MKSMRVLVAGVVAATTMSAAAMAAEDKVLNVYNWSDYIAEDTIANFEKETGIKVVYDVYDANETLEAKLLAGKSGYDIAVPTSPFLQRQIAAGVYRKLDKDKIPNLANLDPDLMKGAATYDPGNEHAVIYMWGTNGIGYNVGKVKDAAGEDAPVASWKLVFDPAYAEKVGKCGLYFLDSPTEIFPLALNYLGLDPVSENEADYQKVEDLLMKIRPFITKFHSSEYIDALANGDACVAVAFSGDVFIAADRAEEANNGQEIAYTIPTEGTLMWFDMMGILKDAPHPENAHKFIDFILRPEETAKITNYVSYANANLKSLEFVDKEVAEDPAIYPTPDVMKRLFTQKPVSAKIERLRTRIWNKVKTGT